MWYVLFFLAQFVGVDEISFTPPKFNIAPEKW